MTPQGDMQAHGAASELLLWRAGSLLALPLGTRAIPKPGAAAALFVRPQEPGHFGAQQFDEGPREHLLGLLGCVLEVVLGVSQHVEEGLDQLLVLKDTARPPEVLRGAGLGWRACCSPLQCWGRWVGGLAGRFGDPKNLTLSISKFQLNCLAHWFLNSLLGCI